MFNKAQLAQYKKVNALALAQLQANMQLIAELEDTFVSNAQAYADDAVDNAHMMVDGEIVVDCNCTDGWDLHSNYLKVAAAFSTLYGIVSADELNDVMDDVVEELA